MTFADSRTPAVTLCRVVNFLDVCSRSMLPVLDLSFSQGRLTHDESIFVDLSDSDVRDCFVDSIAVELKKVTSFGCKTVFVKSCRPWRNWRSSQRGSRARTNVVSTLDDSVVLKSHQLDGFIDRAWSLLEKRSPYVFLEHEEMDSLDLLRAVVDAVGHSFVDVVPVEFKILVDNNVDAYPDRSQEIPAHMTDFVKRKLTAEHVIA